MTESHQPQEELKALREVAIRAAKSATQDEQLIEEAANEAVRKFDECRDAVRDPKAWVAVVAKNIARRVGKKKGREAPFGALGSAPPPQHDEMLDQHVERLIADMHQGGTSVGSLVANRLVFEERWSLLKPAARELLEKKYVEGYSAREIAEQLNIQPGTVDVKLFKARAAAREVMLDVLDDLRG